MCEGRSNEKMCCTCWYCEKISGKSFCDNEKSPNYGERIDITEKCDRWEAAQQPEGFKMFMDAAIDQVINDDKDFQIKSHIKISNHG